MSATYLLLLLPLAVAAIYGERLSLQARRAGHLLSAAGAFLLCLMDPEPAEARWLGRGEEVLVRLGLSDPSEASWLLLSTALCGLAAAGHRHCARMALWTQLALLSPTYIQMALCWLLQSRAAIASAPRSGRGAHAASVAAGCLLWAGSLAMARYTGSFDADAHLSQAAGPTEVVAALAGLAAVLRLSPLLPGHGSQDSRDGTTLSPAAAMAALAGLGLWTGLGPVLGSSELAGPAAGALLAGCSALCGLLALTGRRPAVRMLFLSALCTAALEGLAPSLCAAIAAGLMIPSLPRQAAVLLGISAGGLLFASSDPLALGGVLLSAAAAWRTAGDTAPPQPAGKRKRWRPPQLPREAWGAVGAVYALFALYSIWRAWEGA